MDHQVDDPLGDPLARDLEALLAVEPSPEFLAQVRTRVASETMGRRWQVLSRSWSFQPLFAVGIAAIVLAVVIPAWLRPEVPPVVEQRAVVTLPVQQQAELVRLKPDTTTETPAAPRQQVVRSVRLQPDRDTRRGRLRAARPDVSPFAEVLVSENEQRAFAMLLTRIEQGRLSPVPAPATAADSIEPPALEIPDLVMEPLPQIAALE